MTTLRQSNVPSISSTSNATHRLWATVMILAPGDVRTYSHSPRCAKWIGSMSTLSWNENAMRPTWFRARIASHSSRSSARKTGGDDGVIERSVRMAVDPPGGRTSGSSGEQPEPERKLHVRGPVRQPHLLVNALLVGVDRLRAD